MEEPQFSPNDVEELGKKILSELYTMTEGDEWQPVLVVDIFKSNKPGLEKEYYKNKHYRNNALQDLIQKGYIITDEKHEIINITHRGKQYTTMIGSED
jgi:hypothetical protein